MKNSNTYTILRPSQVCEKLGISLPTLWRYSKESDFPSKISIGKRAVGYRSDHIAEYIERNTEPKN